MRYVPPSSQWLPPAVLGGCLREAYRRRNIIERMINKLKNFRRIATRYEKRAANYLTMIMIAVVLLWL